MPPIVPRKRPRSESSSEPRSKRQSKNAVPLAKPRPTVFDTLDADSDRRRTVAENKAFLARQFDSDSGSGLSDADSEEFENVLSPQRSRQAESTDEHEGSDEGVEWEDAIQDSRASKHFSASPHRQQHLPSAFASHDIKDLEITLSRPDGVGSYTVDDSAAIGRKGPSKIERLARHHAHCMHVQFLMWHNAIRNSWINDKQVQKILVNNLPGQVKKEISRFKGILSTYSDIGSDQEEEAIGRSQASNGKQKAKGRAKAKEKSGKQRIRDWGAEAQRQTSSSAYFSNGDPLLRLLRYLAAYWKKRFRVTAPMLRKHGYKSTRELEADIKSFQNDAHDPTRHGERVASLDEFRELARKCQGSRDVGAQLFTALLRGLGLQCRMIASLQPTGFGWTKAEEAKPKKGGEEDQLAKTVEPEVPRLSEEESDLQDLAPEAELKPVKSATTHAKRSLTKKAHRVAPGTQYAPIDVDDRIILISETPSSDEESLSSVIDVTPARTPRKLFDKDVTFPTYWTEVLCPATNTYFSVSALVNGIVAQKSDEVAKFEPRGAAADKAKVVICYVLAYSEDGTAKDVTVRYLKNHIWPGRTKGFRLAPEKIPIYNKRGKIIRYEEYDWFRRVMSGYTRPEALRTLADEREDQVDLIAVMPSPKAKDGSGHKGEETLQGYKNSAEFVLERHLKREEALLPGAKVVKYFHVGKGGKLTKEAVYRRADVVSCKTVETWHKEGRQVRSGEQPLKHVPYRAVTLVRKRELEDAAKDAGGERPLQGLYAEDQTEWIIPDPIGPDGSIPKNAFGNIDVYVPSMVPKGATHVPLRGTKGICKKLGIDFAEAVTGFEFGKQRAVPVITGVVVAEGHRDALVDAWKEQQEIQRQKDDLKREARVLALWKKFLIGMRVIERMKREYGTEGGDVPDEVNPFTNRGRDDKMVQETDDAYNELGLKRTGTSLDGDAYDDNMSGGFLPEGIDVELQSKRTRDDQPPEGGVYVRDDVDCSDKVRQPAEVEVEIHDGPYAKVMAVARKTLSYPDTPISLQSLHKDSTLNDDETTELSDLGTAHTSHDGNLPPQRPIQQSKRVTSRGCRKRAVPPRSPNQRKTRQSASGISSAGKDVSSSDGNTSKGSSDEESEEYVAPKRRKKSKNKAAQASGPNAKRASLRASTRSAATKSPYFTS